MGQQERDNIARYRAAQTVLDRGAELSSILWKRRLPSQADGLRQRLGWLVLALADGELTRARQHAESVERAVVAVARRVGARREVLWLLAALCDLKDLLGEETPRWEGLAEPMPAPGDWTTATWHPPDPAPLTSA